CTMSRILAAMSLAAAIGIAATALADPPDENRSWHMKASLIEACSCPMLCPTYFSKEPAAHAGQEGRGVERFCRSNNALRIDKGSYGKTRLDGAMFWIAMDLGEDLS